MDDMGGWINEWSNDSQNSLPHLSISVNPLVTVEFVRMFSVFCIKTNPPPPKNAM
jgi:hypothetical protein